MTPEPVVAISALEHHAYCPRQCALIHVDGVWADNVHVIRGARGHRRADAGVPRTERGRRVLRSIPLWSESLGLSGRADVVELHDDGRLVPVEYKIGRRHGLTAHLQVAAQALCLEEMTSTRVPSGAIWFSTSRRREEVLVDECLRELTLTAIEAVRANLASTRLPPAPNDERCQECQLLGHCLPEVVAQPGVVDHYVQEILWCGS